MMFAYWAVVAAIVILNLAGITTISWWVVALMVSLPLVIWVVVCLACGAMLWVADK